MGETMTIVLAVLSSSTVCSVVTLLLNRWFASRDRDTAERQMLLGLAHDRLYYILRKIQRDVRDGRRIGITPDEYDNIKNYLYTPYRLLNGNGVIERMMGEIEHLPTVTEAENLEAYEEYLRSHIAIDDDRPDDMV